MLTLASDVSQAYFELLGLRLQRDIARETTQILHGYSEGLFRSSPGRSWQCVADIARHGRSRHLCREPTGPGAADCIKGESDQRADGQEPRHDRDENQAARRDRSAHGPCRFAFRLDGAPAGYSRRRGKGAIRQRPDRCGQIGLLPEDWPHYLLRQTQYATRRYYFREYERLEPRGECLRPYLSRRRSQGAHAGRRWRLGKKPRRNTCKQR